MKDLNEKGLENQVKGTGKEMKGQIRGDLGDATDNASEHIKGRASEGFKEGERTYTDRLAAVAGNTYALRSVNYDNSDVLVVFRVVRRDDDGSVVLLWKMLKRFHTPQLAPPPPVAARPRK